MSDSDSYESSPLLNKLSVNKDGKSPSKISRRYLEDVSSSDKQQRDPFVVKTPIIARISSNEDLNQIMQYNRYRYYSKLSGAQPSHLRIPDHALPRELFWPHRGAKGAKQSSFITIFAIWNTMMGTSLLSLPWAVQQSGFALGIGLIILMGIICLFTCLLIVESGRVIGNTESIEFIDVCEKLLGKTAKYVAFIFGVVAFLGAVLVYWVLMSNFLYKVGKFAHEQSLGNIDFNTTADTSLHLGVHCFTHDTELNKTSHADLHPSSDNFYKYWDQKKTVPLFLVCLLLPLSSFKSPTFFTKFNALGTSSVVYIVIFVIVKSIGWGGHLHFDVDNISPSEPLTKLYNLYGFPSLTGILALALYIHNAILSILATNEKPENNKRDVSIAYLLTASTYFLVAVLFYSCFPLPKDCIEQVFLDNFPSSDIMTVVAQCGLLFQMTTVFPLLLYILRVQIYGFVSDAFNVSYLKIIMLNTVFIGCGVLMAVFYPEVGHIIRYVGSLSGLVYIFTLPSLVRMKILSMKSKLTKPRIIFYTFLILLGVLNLAAQFLVKD